MYILRGNIYFFVTVQVMLQKELIVSIFPLHEQEALRKLFSRWLWSKTQPIGKWTAAKYLFYDILCPCKWMKSKWKWLDVICRSVHSIAMHCAMEGLYDKFFNDKAREPQRERGDNLVPRCVLIAGMQGWRRSWLSLPVRLSGQGY